MAPLTDAGRSRLPAHFTLCRRLLRSLTGVLERCDVFLSDRIVGAAPTASAGAYRDAAGGSSVSPAAEAAAPAAAAPAAGHWMRWPYERLPLERPRAQVARFWLAAAVPVAAAVAADVSSCTGKATA